MGGNLLQAMDDYHTLYGSFFSMENWYPCSTDMGSTGEASGIIPAGPP